MRVRGEGDDRGWDGWMASRTQWTWVWVNSGSCWWTGKPGMLQSMGSQRVGHDWATELNWTELSDKGFLIYMIIIVIFFPIPSQGVLFVCLFLLHAFLSSVFRCIYQLRIIFSWWYCLSLFIYMNISCSKMNLPEIKTFIPALFWLLFIYPSILKLLYFKYFIFNNK